MSSRHEKLAHRLTQILRRLNSGERLDVHRLAEEFAIDIRTIQRDLNERLGFLEWDEQGRRYYRLDTAKLGWLTTQDIERFARFCSIQDLLPQIDRSFFHEQLAQSIQIKGLSYENVKDRRDDFNKIRQAVEHNRIIEFHYEKSDGSRKYYTLEPYALVNRNGIWYTVGIDCNGRKEKTFCFTQMSSISGQEQSFQADEALKQRIQENDSISHGNQLAEVVIQVAPAAVHYFTRRKILPNQETLRHLENGGLLLVCNDVHEMDIIPTVQYWIPHLRIISPEDLQEKVIGRLKTYLADKV
ncbi:helix-turn-helix transcriptional regulator [Neisseria sp. CCUG12390]|uniref:helix-turn-helix transcriptional regulator n=1 Tax=Neisseria sp. CCUG12390 TaxID=3392035 RepID=UPI003A1008EB